MLRLVLIPTLLLTAIPLIASAAPQAPAPRSAKPATSIPGEQRLQRLKAQAATDIDALATVVQQTVDSIFSFGELGFQEIETSGYLVDLLRKQGFTVREGLSGMPTGWVATWGSGKPVIALGSDIDGIPQASQKPGVAYRDPLIDGAPGHGEGHNSGQAVNIAAAIAVKNIMARERLSGTLVLWPGVAEELLGSKAWFVRDGLFKDVDVALFSHVDSEFATSWGNRDGTGLVSIEYTFTGQTAHSAGAPWRGRSALDAVELMNVGWNYRREHLRLQQRSHYVVTDGGDQPNVVPRTASVWYYFRETQYSRIKDLWEMGNQIAEGAAKMTNTTFTSRILGTAWPQHFNKPVAEALDANIRAVGLPSWSDPDQRLARAIQKELGVKEEGLKLEVEQLRATVKDEDNKGGGSDDIGDVSWTVPTATLRYPANIPGLPGHNWANAVAMATPIAHKGSIAGAKAMAMTLVDLLATPSLVAQAWDYFRNVQTKEIVYTPFITEKDPPAVWLNKRVMETYREQMRKYYYDPTKYKTYLEQLGIEYPTTRPAQP
jgi:aminobenzoyl-glutamate utilization protein B